MIIVYSTTRVPADFRPEGARYVNPAFFDKPEPGATLVYLNGDHPKVRAAYERAGVPVVDLRTRTAPVVTLIAPSADLVAATQLISADEIRGLEVDGPQPGEPMVGVGAVNTLPALADLPEAEQAEVEAVLDDDAPFEGMADTDQS